MFLPETVQEVCPRELASLLLTFVERAAGLLEVINQT
jgi:hypothetical protein